MNVLGLSGSHLGLVYPNVNANVNLGLSTGLGLVNLGQLGNQLGLTGSRERTSDRTQPDQPGQLGLGLMLW